MSSICIHGFRAEQCASCRSCPHGLAAGKCGRCIAASTSAARRRIVRSPVLEPATEHHNGFEIFFAPAVNGWQFRSPDLAPSRESYRSVFLARKAIDSLPPAEVAGSARKRSG
ncbi:MAG: hypothetical protein ACRDHD_12495 [Candidatus Limnocylindria bacterium]